MSDRFISNGWNSDCGGSDCWKVVAASVIGVSHAKVDLPCQDAHRWLILPGGLLMIAVADGAGSATLSEAGAGIAIESATTCLVEMARAGLGGRLTSVDGLAEALRAARSAVELEAERREVALRELASTLILVVAGPTGIVAAQVGDGAVIAGGKVGRLHAVTRPPESEYANETTFLISDGFLETAQFAVWSHPVAHLAVFTDGLQRLALNLPKGEPHAPFFDPLFRFATAATDEDEATRQLAQFLKSPRIAERADDDLTLLLATGRK